ncbi:SWIM-type domain-containing protein [Citrus sinensis]|nr:SWIM-type domain-containing protein [Citrus sinensis]
MNFKQKEFLLVQHNPPFIGILNSYLEKISEKVGISTRIHRSDSGCTRGLIEKVGFLMGRDVVSLVLEACISLRIWELVETLIVHGLIGFVFVFKYSPDLGSSELLCILKYFLCPLKDAYGSMGSVRMEWESQVLLAIEKASDENPSRKKLCLAKEASILLMVAHDGFSVSELCLHYLLASSNIDEVMLSSAISNLNGMSLIRYLGNG